MVTEHQQPAPLAVERLDISGRDLATLEPIEFLAWAYPEVYALMRERDAAVAALDRARAIAADNQDHCESCALVLNALDGSGRPDVEGRG